MHAAAAPTMLVLAACSAPQPAEPPTATADEQRALAEARSMIPAEELPSTDATPRAAGEAAR